MEGREREDSRRLRKLTGKSVKVGIRKRNFPEGNG
jgi:hypothetical protein